MEFVSVLMSLSHILVVPSPLSRNGLALVSFRCAKGWNGFVTLFVLIVAGSISVLLPVRMFCVMLVDSMALQAATVYHFSTTSSYWLNYVVSLLTSSYNFERTGPRTSEFLITSRRRCKR